MPDEKKDNFTIFKEIIARLRAPAPDGCPWDRKQTHISLKPYLVEECYEVIDALDKEDAQKLREELGDLMLQIMLHSQIAAEQGDFNIDDVLQDINSKLIRRHPHIFGNVEAKDAEQVRLNWEEIKKREHGQEKSILDGVSEQIPALPASQILQQRASRVGFDWDSTAGVLDKVVEEAKELTETSNHQEKVAEFGDLLFALVNLARWMDVDAEAAMRAANQRFIQRFQHMEQLCREKNISLSKLSLEEMNALWEQAKSELKDA
jgi:tetrapyrrole methylase family protein/MazG family protein